MFQPFELFKAGFIEKLRQMNRRYLVAQSYERVNGPLGEEPKTGILLTDYDSRGGANIHWNAVKKDKYAAVLDLEKEVHRNKLLELLAAGSPYRLFWSVVSSKHEVQERINGRYIDNMRRYIEQKTRWKIGGAETIYPSLDVTFGELFITLKYSGQTLRIKFDDIEKM